MGGGVGGAVGGGVGGAVGGGVGGAWQSALVMGEREGNFTHFSVNP